MEILDNQINMFEHPENSPEVASNSVDEQTVEEITKVPETNEKEQIQARLAVLCKSMKENNTAKKKLEAELDEQKVEFKEIMQKLDETSYEDEFVKVSMSVIDKTTLDEIPTINYLKEHGLTEYIHTKEFFDYAELGMGITQHKINASDLAQFRKEKTETRINIK